MLTVVTGWSPKGWKEYGENFVETFLKNWPEEVRLMVYTEEPQDLGPRVQVCSIWSIPGCSDFIRKWTGSRMANGREPSINWKRSCVLKGYNFKFDAVKFCRQGFIPLDAALKIRSGLMCWLDGDVTTFAKVPSGAVEELLPEGKDVAYLGRGEKHSEIGFQLYRIPNALEMLRLFSDMYKSESVFELKEWHSAFVFDTARKVTNIAGHDLTAGCEGEPWKKFPLFKYTYHLKGDRKKLLNGASK